MALNSTPRRRFGVALGVVLTGVTAGLIGFAGAASAHTPKVEAGCDKGTSTTTLTVNLKDYRVKHGKINHVKVQDGDKVLEEKDFPDKFSGAYKTSGAENHSFLVTVTAWDDLGGKNGWSFTDSRKVDACVTPPTETSPTTETTTTTTSPEAPPTQTTSSSPAAPPVVATSTTTPVPAAQGGKLAETGASIALPLGIGGVLLLGGVGALFVVRRRSKA